jgi:hypothetical protein
MPSLPLDLRLAPLRWLVLMVALVLPLSACHDDFALYEPPRPQVAAPVAVAPQPPRPAETRPEVTPTIVISEPERVPPGTGATVTATPTPPPATAEAESPLIAQQRRGCEAEGGVLRPRPGGLLACVRLTGDSGRACTASSQCQSECLARSGTCAPVTPLFGCHEVLLAAGSRVTQCVD